MARTEKQEVIVCSDCREEVYRCNGCGNYFSSYNMKIICQESDTIQKHYCYNDCRKEVTK